MGKLPRQRITFICFLFLATAGCKKTAAPRPPLLKKHMAKHLCRAARAIAGCHRGRNCGACCVNTAAISHTNRARRPWRETQTGIMASITGVANSIAAAKAGQACRRMRFTGMRYTCRYPNPFQNIPTVDPLLGRTLTTGNGNAVARIGKRKTQNGTQSAGTALAATDEIDAVYCFYLFHATERNESVPA